MNSTPASNPANTAQGQKAMLTDLEKLADRFEYRGRNFRTTKSPQYYQQIAKAYQSCADELRGLIHLSPTHGKADKED